MCYYVTIFLYTNIPLKIMYICLFVYVSNYQDVPVINIFQCYIKRRDLIRFLHESDIGIPGITLKTYKELFQTEL